VSAVLFLLQGLTFRRPLVDEHFARGSACTCQRLSSVLGIREFAAHFSIPDGSETVLSKWTDSLGFMLYDVRYGVDGNRKPGFFDAKIANGVLHCESDGCGPNGEPPVKVHGCRAQSSRPMPTR
jgi:hypothetical protein